MQKVCLKCGAEKDITLFPTRRSASDGRRGECKSCTNAYRLEWKENNRDKVSCYSKKYGQKQDVIERSKIAAKRYRERNKDKVHAMCRDWYAQNKSLAKASCQNWREKNPHWYAEYRDRNKARLKERARKWSQTNKSAVNHKTRMYQTRKKNAQPPWLTAIDIAFIAEKYDVAAALTTQTGISHHVDHIYPLQGKASSGLHAPWNLQVIPYYENLKKSNKLPTGEQNGQ